MKAILGIIGMYGLLLLLGGTFAFILASMASDGEWWLFWGIIAVFTFAGLFFYGVGEMTKKDEE